MALQHVLIERQPLETRGLEPVDREIAYGVVRAFYHYHALYTSLVDKPLPSKHGDIYALILAGLYSVDHLRRPAHASVNACVEAASQLRKKWARGLVNAVLRNYLRKRESLITSLPNTDEVRHNHPGWMIGQWRADWPAEVDDILAANNERPPMTLRVNERETSRADYLARLEAAGVDATPCVLSDVGVTLATPMDVGELPGFDEGQVSVQDEASQLAAALINAHAGQRVLDACAAPGGKTCHLLERVPGIELTANDTDAARLGPLQENIERLRLDCVVSNEPLDRIEGDFDRILLDAPCTATGIIRRHPDIKLLRTGSDVAKLASVQAELLRIAWSMLRPGGELLYSTCSIMLEENDNVVSRFIAENGDAQRLPVSINSGRAMSAGHQLFPSTHDGFYYARLGRHPA